MIFHEMNASLILNTIRNINENKVNEMLPEGSDFSYQEAHEYLRPFIMEAKFSNKEPDFVMKFAADVKVDRKFFGYLLSNAYFIDEDDKDGDILDKAAYAVVFVDEFDKLMENH
ncbi:MAG: hypothetical protein HQK66_04535 [Desulfamplus sp.]|nr:hypothetical protein [Desulfamplus sp.]